MQVKRGRKPLQPIRPLFYRRGGDDGSGPLDYGVALYCRIWVAEYDCRDFRWNKEAGSWETNVYVGRLLSRGEPDLDQIEHSDLPEGFPWPPF